ncbi:MAG: M28 family peptidase [Myxococcota bacterium]|nr:M28 family peptidase [Myxococcota bacterium]
MRRAIGVVLFFLLAAGCGGAGSPAASITPEGFPPETPRLAAHVRAVRERFDPERARATVAFVDQFFRVRGNEGYQASLARVREELRGRGGFEESAVRTLELGEVRPTWTPRSAELVLVAEDGSETPLVSFATEQERDRAALLVGSSATERTTLEVVRAERVREGEPAQGRLVLAEGEPRPLYREVVEGGVEGGGAAGILVRNLEAYHQAERFPESAQFGYLRPNDVDPSRHAIGFSLSDRAWRALRAATEDGVARVRVRVDVATGSSAATAIEARIDGSDPSAGAIVLATHVDEPGANDNASGVAALVELAGALRRAIEEGAVARPRRALVFVWGQEIEVSGAWLDQASEPVAAGLVMDMVGQDPEATGAPFLIERMPDPGAVWLRGPDVHSEWGSSEVDPTTLRGHFLNDWLRAGIARVASAEGIAWTARAHPFEGGSDHVSFLRRELPAVLAWHFTDDAYHTTRDRLERVSGEEMRRVAALLGGAALSMASGERADREEMLSVVRAAAIERLGWAGDAGRAEIARGGDRALEQRIVREWARWYDQAIGSIAAWDGDDPVMRAALTDARGAVAARARDVERALE